MFRVLVIREACMKVGEIMTKKPVCCRPSSSTLSAALLMKESDTGFLPVIQDLFTPTLVGVVTDRDLCLCVVASGRDPSSAGLTDVCRTIRFGAPNKMMCRARWIS
jgi:CBS domain-containing protein